MPATSNPRAERRAGDGKRVAVIADVHGDLEALQRVLAAIDLAQVDAIWCLGDIVGLGATEPSAVLDLVRGRCAVVLAGNHDRWVSGDLSLDMLPLPRQRVELEHQRRQLSRRQLAWLSALHTHEREGDVHLWHGNAEDPVTGGIVTAEDATGHLARQRAPIGLVGHTHKPLLAATTNGTTYVDPEPSHHAFAGSGRVVLNPGAVVRERRWLELGVSRRDATWHIA